MIKVHLLAGMQVAEQRHAAQHRHNAYAKFGKNIIRTEQHPDVVCCKAELFGPGCAGITCVCNPVLDQHGRRQRQAEEKADQRQRCRPDVAAHGLAHELKGEAI